MGLATITVLFLLVVHALSAPSGCIESCTSYHRTYQTQTAGGYQDHAGLTQAVSNLDDVAYTRPGNWSEHNQYRTDGGHGNIHEERGQYVDGAKRVRYYKKNFTSAYSTSQGNGGGLSASEQLNHGRYGTVYVPTSSQQIQDSRRAYDQTSNLQTTAHQEEYNRIHRERLESVSSHRADQSQRLEDFGEYAGSSQHGASRYDSHSSQGQAEESSPSNWSRVDHYGTDGGRGHVYEEEGQYVQGPKNVRYYKRNYTSSYTSGGVPTSDVSATGTHEIHKEIEKLHREIDREIQHISSTANRQPIVVPTVGAVDYRHQASHESLATSVHRNEEEHASSVSHGPVIQVPHVSPIIQVPLVNPVIQVPHVSPVVQVPHVSPIIQVPHVSPTQRVYTSERRHNSYERHEGYVPVTETEQRLVSPLSSYSQVHTDRNSAYGRSTLNRVNEHRTLSDLHQTELLNTHESRNVENHFGSDRLRQGAYDQQVVVRPTIPGQVSHYKEQFSSASHTRESTFPQVSSDTVHVNRGTESEEYNRHQYRDQHSSHSSQGRGSYHDQLRHSNFNSAYRTPSGNLATGVLDMGQVEQSADCTQDVEQVQYGSHYHRNYKRSAKYNEQDDMQHHQHDDLTQQTDDTNDQLQQQADGFPETSGKLEFGQQTQYPEDDDLTQQTAGKLEFGRQQEYPRQSHKPKANQESNDMTQQTNGHLDFTQQNEDLSQQTAALDDFLQQFAHQDQREHQSHNHLSKPIKPHQHSILEQNAQTSSKPEFGQRRDHIHRRPITGNEHLEDLGYSQQTEDLTQQTSGYENFDHSHGQLEFGQQTEQSYPKPTAGNQHLEDLTQHGKLEFGQHGYNPRQPTVENQHLGHDNRESTRFPQEISGLEQVDRHRNPVYGQQTQWSLEDNRHNQHSDLTQQNEDLSQVSSSGFENFGQHSGYRLPSRKPVNSEHPEHSTAHGTLEFGRPSQKPGTPTVENQHDLENVMQQNEDLTQQIGGFDDLTQQTSGKLEFGQQTQYPQHTWRPATGNQHLEEFTQQNEGFTQHTGDLNDHTQQTIGKLEFGQQTENHFQPWGQLTDLTQANEDLTQQTTGNLEFGQYQQKPHRPTVQHNNHRDTEDLTQGQLELGQHQQHNNAFEQTTENQYGNIYDQSEGDRWDWQKPSNLQKEDLGQLSINLEFGQNPSTNDQVSHSDYRQESVPFYVGSQTTEEPIGVLPLEQEHIHNKPKMTTGPKPAEKPKPRPRYSKPVVIEPHTENGDISLTGSHPALPKADPEVDLDDIRAGNLRGDQDHDDDPDKDNRDSSTQTRVSATGIDRGNMDQVNLLHKSNDATVGLQWHYTYHPSDLTNSEPVQNSFYPGLSYNSDMQQKEYHNKKNLIGQSEQQENENNPIVHQETKPIDIIPSQSEGKELVGGTHQSGYGLFSQSHRVEAENNPIVHQETKPVDIIQSQSEDKDLIGGAYHQSGYGLSSHSHNQYHRVEVQGGAEQETLPLLPTQNYGASQVDHREERVPGVKGGHHRQAIQNQPRAPRLESRIFEAYGGGPYDGTYTDDVYSRVTPSPSATLPPLNAEDPWDVREKPREYSGTTIIAEIIPDVPESTESPEATTEPPPPSFWGKLGNKITRTFDKAKEKARGIFG